MGGDKGAVAREGFNAAPFVGAFDARRKLPARGRGGRRIKRRLRQHGAPAQDAAAGGIAHVAAIIFDRGNLRGDALDEFGVGADTRFGRHRHLQFDPSGHTLAKKMPRPRRGQGTVSTQGAPTVNAGPLRHFCDEEILHRVSQRVHDGALDVLGRHQLDGRWPATGPKVLPAAAITILAPCQQRMKVMHTLRQPAITVEQGSVVMIGNRAGRDDHNVETDRRQNQAVQIIVVGLLVGPQ